MQESRDEMLIVYPNPASDKLNVATGFTPNGRVKLMVYNQQGQLVYNSVETLSASGSIENIDISGFVPGIYNLQLLHGNKIYSKVFVKKTW